jgi:hypothetical protein
METRHSPRLAVALVFVLVLASIGMGLHLAERTVSHVPDPGPAPILIPR